MKTKKNKFIKESEELEKLTNKHIKHREELCLEILGDKNGM